MMTEALSSPPPPSSSYHHYHHHYHYYYYYYHYRYKELLERVLESKELKKSCLNGRFHIVDLLGLGEVMMKETAAGKFIRLAM